jgi:hypothetical protein
MTTTPSQETSVSTIIRSIPRSAVQGYLRALRLPLDAASRVADRNADRPWAPSIAYEGFEAKVKDVTGRLLKDDVLSEQAEVQRARVSQLRKAAENIAAADAKQAVADRELDERRAAAEQKEMDAAEKAKSEKAQNAEREKRAKADARRRASRQKKAATSTERNRKQAVAEKATTAKAADLEAKRIALLERKEATEAKAGAREIGEAAETTRRRRRARSR